MTPREKALKRLGTLLRLAHDERSPEGEREAAKRRCLAIQERWEFTPEELTGRIRKDQEAERPDLARRRRAEEILRARRAAAMAARSSHLIFVGQPIRMAINYGSSPKNVFVEWSGEEP